MESYRTEEEKANLLYWQVTCESFFAQRNGAGFTLKPGTQGTSLLYILNEDQALHSSNHMVSGVRSKPESSMSRKIFSGKKKKSIMVTMKCSLHGSLNVTVS